MSRAPRIPDAQWEVHKGVIKSLYLEQNKTIKEIQEFMDEKHQFHATEKQYIRKVTVNWKLRKNTTKEEWEQASALVLKRKAEGKPTELTIHGKIISDKKRKKEIRRYAQKNLPGSPVLSLLETVAARTPPTANRNITYFTIPWLNLQAQLTSPALRDGVYSMFNGTIESTRHSMISSSPLSQNQVAEEHLATSLLRSVRAGDVPGIDSGETISSMLKSLDEQIPCGYSHRTEIQSQQTPITESWSRLFFSLVFLSTNNRLEQQVLVNFLKLAISHKLLLDLKQALSVQGPTMRLFSVALLSTALDIPDEEGLQLVRYLLQQGVNPNTVHASRRPLWRAVSSGRKEAVRLLLDHGADPFATFPSLRPCSPSQMKLYNSESLAEALIDQRHNITWDLTRNESILLKASISLAVEAGDEPRVRHLLQVGADPNFVDPVSLSLLHVAVRCEDAVQVHLLVEFGADPDIFSRAETMKRLRTMFPETFDLNKEHYPPIVTPLQLAVEKGQLNVARQLLQGGANPDGTLDLDIPNNREENYHQKSFAFTALQIASKRDKYGSMSQETAHEIVKLLLRAGAGVDTRHVMQSTALQHVCGWRPNGKTKMKTVDLLLEWGADVNALPSQENGKSSLEAAAEAGDIDLVTMLLRRGADCSNSTSLLRAAVRSDGKGIVNFLLDHFSKAGLLAVDMADNWGEYLEIAAKSGNIQVLNMILESCVDTSTNRYEKHVINAMEAATECNKWGVLGRLLMTGVNPDTDGRACRILSKAIRRPLADENDTSCFTLLMSKFTALGLDLNKPLPGDATPLWTAIRVGDAVAAQCLIFSGIDVNTPSFCDDGMSNVRFERPMAQAISRDECMHSRGYSTCLSGDFECACWVEFLLTNGANVDCLVDKSKTALLLALKSGGYEAAETLLKHGANPNAEDLETGMDAFDMIHQNDFWPPFSTFKSLIDYGYQINAKSDNGTLIQFIAKAHPDASSMDHGRWEIAELVVPLLLDSGAAVNTCATEEHPMTALQDAIDGNRKELTNILLAAGADIHAPAFWKKGKTTLQAACYAGNLELVKSLVAQGLDINAQPASHYGATALQFAAMQGHFNIATFLLENGALINAPAALVDGRTALQGAAEHGRLDMIYLLLENDQDDGLEERCEDAARFAEAESRFEIAQLLREYRKV